MNPEKYGGKNFKLNVPCRHFVPIFPEQKAEERTQRKIWMRSTLKNDSLWKGKASAERACWQEDNAMQRAERQGA